MNLFDVIQIPFEGMRSFENERTFNLSFKPVEVDLQNSANKNSMR